MAYHHTTVVDNQIKALPTVDTASGSIATFNTDLTENLVSVKCQIVAQQSGSGTPSPSNPRPITTYTSLNLSHSGSDTSNPTVYNIPFGQTVANGVLDVTTGKLRVTHEIVDLGSLNYSQGFSGFYTTSIKDFVEIPSTVAGSQLLCSIFSVGNTANNDNMYIQFAPSYLGWVVFLPSTSYATASAFKTAMSGINLVYKLATPYEIQLDSTQITALLNENNIWCDTGDTEVKYLLTVGKKIS